MLDLTYLDSESGCTAASISQAEGRPSKQSEQPGWELLAHFAAMVLALNVARSTTSRIKLEGMGRSLQPGGPVNG